jgi:tetrahydromethanopterin S-methyltransferase subunit A
LDALAAAGSCALDAAVCPTEPVEARSRWPSLPGSYRVLRYRTTVAVCTLNTDELIDPVSTAEHEVIAITDTLQTENLGIERLITKVVYPLRGGLRRR